MVVHIYGIVLNVYPSYLTYPNAPSLEQLWELYMIIFPLKHVKSLLIFKNFQAP